MRKIGYIITCLCFSLSVFPQQKNQKQQQKFTTTNKKITVYTTAANTQLRLTPTDHLNFTASRQPIETELSVFVEPSKRFQSFLGIGGAITDASAEIFAQLSKEKQTEFLNAYYDTQKGIGYSLLRTTIQSSDFSSGSYSYIEEGDKDLKTFSIDHDRKYRLPMIKAVLKKAGGKMITYATPWSPNAFMKSNKNVLKGGTLLPEFYQPWANFYAKFIKAYEKEGIPIWATSVQNEPMATQTWESCLYTAEQERDFLKNYLGPTLKKEGLGKVKIIAWDHNRDLMVQRANVIFSDPEASKYVWGMGFHWYETWTGAQPMFDNVARVHEAYPDKKLIFTEGCVEKFDAAKYQFWPNAERYGTSMINDFNNGTVGWTDWNILLDQFGGPNHVGNFCFAPIHADTTTGELIYTPSYYYIGHFSKFIRPNAVRVSTSVSRSYLSSTSFLNTDGKMATVVMNNTDNAITYNFIIATEQTIVKIPAHAIQTLVY
ncbi:MULTISPECIES: glycoside hydrolase family 30 protein [unclassified Flavobacterium]|uniref:glycoside hydrolase family 30 protein n=1 Tax=unclassified Flavobacterium TaxID=196869 RepID=UPI00201F7BC2|nr:MULTISPECIES: glycoside hydrolase family 30 beta sandwich domain-containing protein [unclassified Flavobacterium]URC14255.1 glycosyl hydrolase [Flavobacterium sp. B183]